MSLNVSDSLFDKYREAADWFLTNENIGCDCVLKYPPKKIACDACTGPVGYGSINQYAYGGPAPFKIQCTYCNGTGYKEQEYTETIRLRVYWRKRDWINAGNIVIPDCDAQIIGFLSDLPKVKRATEIKLVNKRQELNIVVNLASEPFFHGFAKDRYFIAFVKRG